MGPSWLIVIWSPMNKLCRFERETDRVMEGGARSLSLSDAKCVSWCADNSPGDDSDEADAVEDEGEELEDVEAVFCCKSCV